MSNNCYEPEASSCQIIKETECIICPTCQNKITDFKLIRCPRCFSSLIKCGCNGNCSGCGK